MSDAGSDSPPGPCRFSTAYVSARSLTVFAWRSCLISGSVALAAVSTNTPEPGADSLEDRPRHRVCQLCLYYNDLYDLTLVHSSRELVVRLLQADGRRDDRARRPDLTFPALLIGPGTFVTALGVFLVAMLGWRLAFNRVARAPSTSKSVC